MLVGGPRKPKLAPEVNPGSTCAQVFSPGGPSQDMTRSAAVKLAQLGLTLGMALALTFALAASSASAPVLNLGPITVADGTAAGAGTVSPEAAPDPPTT